MAILQWCGVNLLYKSYQAQFESFCFKRTESGIATIYKYRMYCEQTHMEGNVTSRIVARSCCVWYYVIVVLCHIMLGHGMVFDGISCFANNLIFNNMECTVCLCVHTYVCAYLVRWLEGNDISSTHLYKRYDGSEIIIILLSLPARKRYLKSV